MVRTSRPLQEWKVQQHQEEEDRDLSWGAVSWTPIWIPWVHGILQIPEIRTGAQLSHLRRFLRGMHGETPFRCSRIRLYLEAKQAIQGQGGSQELDAQCDSQEAQSCRRRKSKSISRSYLNLITIFIFQGNARDGAADQGYGATANKRDAAGVQGMVVDQHAPQAQQSPAEVPNRAAAVVSKQMSNNMNRGSEFKKTAQQMLNKWYRESFKVCHIPQAKACAESGREYICWNLSRLVCLKQTLRAY